MKKGIEQQKLSIKDKIYVYITLSIITILFLMLFKYLGDSRDKEIELIKSSPVVIKAAVVDYSLYKGKSITLRYFVDGTEYVESDGYGNAKNIKVGDSIYIKYYNHNPKLIISEFNERY